MEERTDPPEKLEPGVPKSNDHTIAWFSSIDQARHAVLALERNGVDSSYIEVATKPTSEDRNLVDKRSMAWMGKLAVVGVIGGILIGAIIAVLIVVIVGAEGVGLVAGVIAGAVFGAFAGGFYSVAVQLPVSEGSFDTFGGEPTGSDWVAVGGPSEVQQKASAVLGDLHPLQLKDAA
ncbi:MAG: hypothetical protein WBA45_04460 [Microthrixaceae bacterium]